jgi:hypothetical protein
MAVSRQENMDENAEFVRILLTFHKNNVFLSRFGCQYERTSFTEGKNINNIKLKRNETNSTTIHFTSIPTRHAPRRSSKRGLGRGSFLQFNSYCRDR